MKELYFFDETFYWGRYWPLPVKTISKYKHLNKNIHEKDDELGDTAGMTTESMERNKHY